MILTSTEPNVFRMLFSIKNRKIDRKNRSENCMNELNEFFSPPKVQEAYNIINFRFLMENSILKKFGSVDVKITHDFCSKNTAKNGRR